MKKAGLDQGKMHDKYIKGLTAASVSWSNWVSYCEQPLEESKQEIIDIPVNEHKVLNAIICIDIKGLNFGIDNMRASSHDHPQGSLYCPLF